MPRKHTKSEKKSEAQTMEDNESLEVQDTVGGSDPAGVATVDEEAPEIRIESLTQEMMSLRQTAEENLERALRAQAELENMHKRTSRDIENAHKFALEKFITELLPVLDSMELGINASDSVEDIASLREGMDLTMKMFRTVLEKFGVKVINPQGEKFNPEQHEAVTLQESGDTASGMVISVMQKGYELNGRLVRPAMVIVAK
jgi:molecular chaperone GrpE